MKTSEAISQQKTTIIKIKPKKPTTLKVININLNPAAKGTPERIESDNSSLGAEGLKVVKLHFEILTIFPLLFVFNLS